MKGKYLRKFIARRGLFVRIPIPSEFKELEAEIKLGRSILDLALLDSLTDPEIVSWLVNEDFETICFIALLDPVETKQRFLHTRDKILNDIKEP